MWIVGGKETLSETPSGFKNDVWSSSDGVYWTLETAEAGFCPRVSHSVVSFNNRMWVIGGYDVRSHTVLGDVWSSADGINWIQATVNGGFGQRDHHACVVFNNKMWIIGGYNGLIYTSYNGGLTNDVWSSTDGVTWTLATPNAGFGIRKKHAVVAFNNKMWLIGGVNAQNNSAFEQVWSSSDGVQWRLETRSIGQLASSIDSMNQTLVFGNKILYLDDVGYVWSSADGVTWIPITNKRAEYAYRRGFASTVFNGYMWVIGGYAKSINGGYDSSSRLLNDVWHSP